MSILNDTNSKNLSEVEITDHYRSSLSNYARNPLAIDAYEILIVGTLRTKDKRRPKSCI